MLKKIAKITSISMVSTFIFSTSIDISKKGEIISFSIAEAQQNSAISVYNNAKKKYHGTGQNVDFEGAIQLFQQAATLFEKEKNSLMVGYSFLQIGFSYANSQSLESSLSYFQQALSIGKDLGDSELQGLAYSGMGSVYSDYGQYDRSIESLEASIHYARQAGDQRTIAQSSKFLAGLYAELSRYSDALNLYKESLDLARAVNDLREQGRILTFIGDWYFKLGDIPGAINSYQEALSIAQRITDSLTEMEMYCRLGDLHMSINRNIATQNLNECLRIAQQINNKETELRALRSLDFDHQTNDIQINSSQEIIETARKNGDLNTEVYELINLGIIFLNRQDLNKSLFYFYEALIVSEKLGRPEKKAEALDYIAMTLARKKETELAIIFYKNAINIYESIRLEIRLLPKNLQESYLSSIADTYRNLANLLIQQDRILEAQRVLDLLKVQELNDLFSDGVRAPKAEQYGDTDYLDLEKTFTVLSDEHIAKALDIGKNIIAIEQIPRQNRTSAQKEQLIALREAEATFLGSFNDFLNSPEVQNIVKELQKNLDNNETFNLFQAETLRDNLQNLRQVNENTAILYPLILEDRLELVLVSADAVPLRQTVQISRSDLNQKISDALTTLKNQDTDYTALIELYNILIKPLEPTLAQADIKTLLYAPDGALRYIPLAALTDGNQWLIEKYRLNNITALSLTDFNQPSRNNELSVLAAAYTDAGKDLEVDLGYRQVPFKGLKHTATEIDQIAQTVSDTEQYRDDQFTRNLIREMNDFSVVHFATHGYFLPAKPKDSFLLFGNGEYSTIDDMKNWNTLTNVDLVVLSACETGVGEALGSGVEILGLGYRLQSKGARAVMSSLWQVQDDSTQVLMTEFYKNLQGGSSKAEALRQAQATLSKNPKYAHPYHWASFILIGNGL